MSPDQEARFIGWFILIPCALVALLGGTIMLLSRAEGAATEVRVFDGGP